MGKFLLGMFLVCLAWMIIGTTEFNESHVFADPGIVDAKAHNLAQWAGVAAHESPALASELSPFKFMEHDVAGGIGLLFTFAFPPLCMLLWPEARRLHQGILVVLVLLVVIDVENMLEFNGNNSANGGYDGLGEMLCYGLHALFGGACIVLMTLRLIWQGSKLLLGLAKV